MGHRVERTQTHMDGKRVIGYRILPLDDLGQAMMDAIGRRIDERIEKAVQSQSEDKPIDYAKFRQDDEPLSESSRDFEPDALLTTCFFINKEDYAYLGNDSGEKSSIPCSWLAYCCDCIG